MSWTCQACGAFVPDGITHTCTGWTVPPVYPSYPPSPITVTDWSGVWGRMVVALERIADALERANPVDKAG